MNNIELLKLLVNEREKIKALLPSDSQAKVIKTVQSNKLMSSRELSLKLSITVQNASVQLNKLHKLGYLLRNSVEDPSGGTFYEYEYAL